MFDFPINAPHIHLLLNHIPIILGAFGSLLMAYGLSRKKWETMHIALFIFIIVALISIPVFFSGGGTFKAVSGIEGINVQALVRHASIALWAFASMILLGLLSGIAWYVNRKEKNIRWYYAVFLFSLIVTSLVVVTGYHGGNIRHSEEIYSSP